MTPEEFAELSVPFIDIDPRFNFWNLPANAKVLLVSNMPEAITKPLEVFNLFRYGHRCSSTFLPLAEDKSHILSLANFSCLYQKVVLS